MNVHPQDVSRIAKLARIEISPEEEDKFGQELSSILDFVEKLNEIETADVKPLAGGTMLETVTREDRQISKDLEGRAAEILGVAPEKKDGWIKVKAVFS